MKETISEPNYSPAELRRVRQPVLVIMGDKDTANAPDEHAQYIADHIPNAELWIPENTGHNVHLERSVIFENGEEFFQVIFYFTYFLIG